MTEKALIDSILIDSILIEVNNKYVLNNIDEEFEKEEK